MPQTSSVDNAQLAARNLIDALFNSSPAAPFATLGQDQLHAIRQLATIFDSAAGPLSLVYMPLVSPAPHAPSLRVRLSPVHRVHRLLGGSLRLDTYPNPTKYIKKNPDAPFFRSLLIFYLRRFTVLNEVGLLTDCDTSKSHDSPTTFKMALYSWPKF